MRQVLIVPSYQDIDGPLIFLAGPVQGAPDWQQVAIEFLPTRTDAHIASPRRQSIPIGGLDEEAYNTQIAWEHYYLERAGQSGVIMFWLAKETEHIAGRAYAQTSRFELGEAVTLHRLQGIKVVVGIEDGFSNKRYLLKTISSKAPNIPLCSTLEETCEQAIKLIDKNP